MFSVSIAYVQCEAVQLNLPLHDQLRRFFCRRRIDENLDRDLGLDNKEREDLHLDSRLSTRHALTYDVGLRTLHTTIQKARSHTLNKPSRSLSTKTTEASEKTEIGITSTSTIDYMHYFYIEFAKVTNGLYLKQIS